MSERPTDDTAGSGILLSSFDGVSGHSATRSDAPTPDLQPEDISAKVEQVLPNVLSPSHAPTQNSKAFIAFLLLNTMIGSGILNQPEVFLKSGICGALMIFLVAGSFIWLGLVCLVACGVEFQKLDYSELAEYAFGAFGEKVVDVLIVLNNFGALLSYLIVVGGTATELFWGWGCASAGCNVYWSTGLAAVFILMPVCSLRFFGHLTYISIFSVLSIAAVLLLVLIGGPLVGEGGVPLAFHGAGGLRKFGSVVFALSCAPASFHAYKSMAHKSTESWNQVSGVAVVAGAAMCIVMGLAGMLAFGEDTDGDILENFTGNYADPFKMLLVIHLLLYIPVDFVVMRHSIVRLMGTSDGNLNTLPHLVLTACLLFLCTTMVLCLRYSGLSLGDSFAVILDFTGGVAGSMTSYVMPAAIYLKLMPKTAEYYYPAVAMFVFGAFVMVTVPIMAIVTFS